MKYRIHPKTLIILMIVSFIVVFLSGRDAIESSKLYNEIDLNNELIFKISEKYNKKAQGESFPDLNYNGEILTSGEKIEIRVSKGDFDKHQIGQEIKVFKSPNTKYMTEYEINNQMIIHIGRKGYSFVFIPVLIFAIIGILSAFGLLKRFVLK